MANGKWDRRFLELAEHVSRWSLDPSTKVGAVVVNDKRQITGTGYNGFARGVGDHPERYADRAMKYKMVVHAEMNAILFSKQTEGCTLYTWPFGPCSECAARIIQVGIKRVVYPKVSEELKQRWGDQLALAQLQFSEAGVETVEFVELNCVDPTNHPKWERFIAWMNKCNRPLLPYKVWWDCFLEGSKA